MSLHKKLERQLTVNGEVTNSDMKNVKGGRKTSKITMIRANPRQSTSYDELVIHAAKYGLINTPWWMKHHYDIVVFTKEYKWISHKEACDVILQSYYYDTSGQKTNSK
jgi:hypothetical protein